MRKIRKLISSIGAVVLTAVLTAGSMPAYAAQAPGSITIKPLNTETNQTVSEADYDGTFRVYRVADYDEYGNFSLAEGFKTTFDPEINGDNLSDDERFKEITKAVTSYVGNNRADLKTVASGVKAGGKVENLTWGLYFVEADKAASNWSAFTSFLVMIPDYSDGKTEVNVEGYPKVTKVETPPPDNPPDNPPPDNPPDNPPPETPPTTPPETPEDEGGEETPPSPSEDTGGLDENGNMNENGEMNEGGSLTGDDSQMVTYGIVAGAAVVVLGGWLVWKRKKDQKEQ